MMTFSMKPQPLSTDDAGVAHMRHVQYLERMLGEGGEAALTGQLRRDFDQLVQHREEILVRDTERRVEEMRKEHQMEMEEMKERMEIEKADICRRYLSDMMREGSGGQQVAVDNKMIEAQVSSSLQESNGPKAVCENYSKKLSNADNTAPGNKVEKIHDGTGDGGNCDGNEYEDSAAEVEQDLNKNTNKTSRIRQQYIQELEVKCEDLEKDLQIKSREFKRKIYDVKEQARVREEQLLEEKKSTREEISSIKQKLSNSNRILNEQKDKMKHMTTLLHSLYIENSELLENLAASERKAQGSHRQVLLLRDKIQALSQLLMNRHNIAIQ